MNKSTIYLSAAFVLLGMSAATSASAGWTAGDLLGISTTRNTFSAWVQGEYKEVKTVSQTEFTNIKNADCDPFGSGVVQENYVFTDGGSYCNPLLAPIENRVIKNELTGRQYWVNTRDGLPTLNRHLDNGFYKVKRGGKNNYFWVSNGIRVRMKVKAEVGPFWKAIGHNATLPEAGFIPVSEVDFARLAATAEAMGTVSAEDTALVAKLNGSIIQRVEHDGSLYYVNGLFSHTEGRADLQVFNDDTAVSVIKENAQKRKWKMLRKLVPARFL